MASAAFGIQASNQAFRPQNGFNREQRQLAVLFEDSRKGTLVGGN